MQCKAMLKPIRFLLLALASPLLAPAPSPLLAQSPTLDPSRPLPQDSAVRIGTLPNGLRYYVRRNARPEKRLELRLVVDAGSVLEDDDQRGLAHVVEHLAFNGTRRFPKQSLIAFLEKSGMRFGADLNAYTSFDETVYQLTIPTDTLAAVAKAFDILEDWASAISFDSTEIRKERGVVIEEWRGSRGAGARVSDRQFPLIFAGSRYADRLPIGTKESLERFSDEALRRFHRDWYRPDLLRVVAVGDLSADTLEAMIREHFARLERRTEARVRPQETLPLPDTTLVSIIADPELSGASVSVLWKRPREPRRTVADLRRALVANFAESMLGGRYSELLQRPNAPFAYAGANGGGLARSTSAWQVSLGVKGSGFVSGLRAALDEVERARRFGFTTSELDRRRTSYLRALEVQFAERDKTPHEAFASRYVNASLTGEPTISAADELALGRALATTITLDEVNAVARNWMTEKNRIILVTAPQTAEVVLPSADSLRVVLDAVARATLTAWVDSTATEPLIPVAPKAGRIVSERKHPAVGITEWRLSNGMRLFVKPTDFKADEVLLSVRSQGGSSLLSTEDALHLEFGTTPVDVGGLGSFNAVTLRKTLTGKVANVSASIGETSESMTGRASPRDLETMFQLLWLRFTAPRADSAAFAALTQNLKAQLQNMRSSPEAVYSDTISVTMTQRHPRVRLYTDALLDSISVSRATALYRERFANAGDFDAAIVGNFTLEQLRPLVERWLAALPATSAPRERFRDTGVRPPAGAVTKVVRKGKEPKARVSLLFTGDFTPGRRELLVLQTVGEVLDLRLRDLLREEMSGTYGASVDASGSKSPYPNAQVTIAFGADPGRLDSLVAATLGAIDSLQRTGPTADELAKVLEIRLRERETSMKQNQSWVAWILGAVDDDRPIESIIEYESLARSITAEDVRQAARRYAPLNALKRFTLLPEP